ncbi:hypothetical protein TCAL_15391 [Tigriopus californicus]|uniref:Uncharacterized protein n=1 Tax=Tigriopus californicus TaxID=6832 RepID=A0A553PK82_TIGCA|nr:hypothetical protein TCAL_15391 [Tigriopus californicus]
MTILEDLGRLNPDFSRHAGAERNDDLTIVLENWDSAMSMVHNGMEVETQSILTGILAYDQASQDKALSNGYSNLQICFVDHLRLDFGTNPAASMATALIA